MAMPCNQDLQYVCELESLLNYILKYITKPEENSAAANSFAMEAFREMDAASEVRKFCQRVIQHATKEHDYSLAEVHLYLNQAQAIVYSRDFVVVATLNDQQVDLNVDANQPVLRKSLPELYDERHTSEAFQGLVNAYDQAVNTNAVLPCAKHPKDISLYEYASMFNRKWTPLRRFKVVHTVPSFPKRPSPTNEDWYRKFMISHLRLHFVPDVPTYEQMADMENAELQEMGDNFFRTDSAPLWASELWFGKSRQSDIDVLPLFPPIGEAEPDDEAAFVGQDMIQPNNMEDNPVAEEDEQEDIPYDDVYVDADASNDFNYHEDRLRLCEDWTSRSPAQFRNSTSNAEVNDDYVEEAIPHDQLNPKQALVVQYVSEKMDRVLDNGEQFFLEVCGSAGTGKTTVMKRLKADLAARLAEHDQLSVGTIVRFVAATGAAAKVLPTPNCTLHRLLNLPLNQAKTKPTEDLSGTALRNLQDTLTDLKLIVIDEKSFVGCRMMYNIDVRLRQIMANDKPFGGVSVILIGDFKQLCPVNDLPLFADSTKGMSPYQQMGYEDVYKTNFQDVIILDKNQRQVNDADFQQIIANFLDRGISTEDWYKLAKRSLDNLPVEEKAEFDRDAIYLCAMKKDYKGRNVDKIKALGNPRIIVRSINVPESGVRFEASKAGNLPIQVLLTRDMRVMLTANLDIPHGLSNGSTGTVVGIVYFSENDPFPTVLVQFEGYTGPSCLPQVGDSIYPVGSMERSWTEGRVNYHREMIPLIPAYGISIHKSQGQTLDKIMINLGPKEFASGLTYTALTRSRGLSTMAFAPMPFMTRINGVRKGKGFLNQKSDEQNKGTMALATLDRYPHLKHIFEQ